VKIFPFFNQSLLVVEISTPGALRLLESLRVLLTSRCALGGGITMSWMIGIPWGIASK